MTRVMMIAMCVFAVGCKSAPQPAPAVVHCQHCAEMEHAGEESGR